MRQQMFIRAFSYRAGGGGGRKGAIIVYSYLVVGLYIISFSFFQSLSLTAFLVDVDVVSNRQASRYRL
jgi:hypothetical protein